MLSPPAAVKYVSLSWAVFYALAVVFGAPFFSDFIATAGLATALVVFSSGLAVFLVDSEEQLLELLTSYFSYENLKNSKESLFLSSSTFAVLGAWAAAAVHPLDWDRWWQRYPLPSLVGCVFGAALGLLFGIVRVHIEKLLAYNKTKKR